MTTPNLLHSFSLTNGDWIDAHEGSVFVCFRSGAEPELVIKRTHIEVLEFFEGNSEVQHWLDNVAVELY